MDRFNKVLKGCKQHIENLKQFQISYRTLRYQKLIGTIFISTFLITGIAIYKVNNHVGQQHFELIDDSQDLKVLQEAKLLQNNNPKIKNNYS